MNGMKNYFWVIYTILLCLSLPLASFQTLGDAQKYAQKRTEYPPVSNKNLLNPDYVPFQKAHLPTFWQQVAQTFNLITPLWSVESFKDQLLTLTKLRQERGYKGDFVQKIVPSSHAQFFIWGEFHSAFHSLVRVLTSLHENSKINDDFTLTDSNYYFIFNGNVIDRSAYGLESLSLVMQLMIKNPHNVIYILGNHEYGNHWYNYDLKRELKIRAKTVSSEKIPLGAEVDAFFKTLPLALYLVGEVTEGQVNTVRISHFDLTYDQINEENFSGFLAEKSPVNTLTSFDLAKKEGSVKKVSLKAFITGQDSVISFVPTEGLVPLMPQKQVFTWSVLSSPTITYQKWFNFFYDAYAVLRTDGPINTWTIALYNQDVRTLPGIKKSQEYYVTTGLRVDVVDKARAYKMQDEKPMLIGSEIDVSSATKHFGRHVKSGLYERIYQQNADGGIHDTFINLSFLEPQEYAKDFIKRGISLVVSPFLLQDSLQEYLDLAKQKKLLLLFPITGTHLFRQSDLSYIINFMPSSAAQSYAVVDYAIRKLNVKTIIFFYEDSEFGKSCLYGARLASKGATITELSYEQEGDSFTKQVETVKSIKPDAIAFFATSIASKHFIEQIELDSLVKVRLLGLSEWSDDNFKSFLRFKGLQYIITNVVPNPKESSVPIVKEFQEQTKKSLLRMDVPSLQGYINGSLFIELVKINNGSFDKETLVKKAESLKNYNFKGLALNFNAKTRELSPSLWLEISDAMPWIEYPVPELDLTKTSSTASK